METQILRTDLWTQTGGSGGEGVGRRYAESNTEINITICKIDNQWEFAA